MNNDVDEIAKIASKFFQITGWNDKVNAKHGTKQITAVFPYEYISYQQMKKEVKKRSQLLDVKRWNYYKYTKKDDQWGQHLREWKITGNKKWYQEELRYLNQHQNQMRILLYSAKLPTNTFIHYQLKQESRSEFCECCDFGGARRTDTIGHGIYECIANMTTIQHLRNNVKKWHDIAKCDFIEDTNNTHYIKQFIFPKMKDPFIRMNILKLTIEFLLFSDPGLVRLAEKFWRM